MSKFKFLKVINFEYLLNMFELMQSSIQTDSAYIESKKNINKLTANETRKQSLDILIESTFLQIYAELEEALYYECEPQLIKKNASILRFETPLSTQGFHIDNEYWRTLLNLAKIRNCLLHGNGRLDRDKYGEDTKDTINSLNSDANTVLLELINLKDHNEGTSKIKLNREFLNYCFIKIKDFIKSQK